MESLINNYLDSKNNTVSFEQEVKFERSKLDFLEVDSSVKIGKGTTLNNCHIRLGRGAKLIIGSGCDISGRIFVGAYSSVVIGNDFTVTNNVYLRAVESTRIIIENDVVLASAVTIRTNDGHSIHDLENGARINPSKDIYIEEHVWLGEEVAVLKGVRISKGCVIGMRSVVTKDIPENVLAVGIPCKIVRHGITWSR